MVGQAFEAIEQKQDAGSEKWTILIDAIKRSQLVQKRGLSLQSVLSRIYAGILLRLYEPANIQDFALFRKYLDQFVCRARIEGPTGLEHDYYRRMYLLSWLRQAGPGPIPSMLLADSDQSCRQFKLTVAVTGTVLQAVLRECSIQRLLTATITFWILLSSLTAIPVVTLMEKLNPESAFWMTGIEIGIVFALFFLHIYRSAVVLDAEGLCSGPLIWKRHIRWGEVYRVWTWNRAICLRLEAEWLCLFVSTRDRMWLEQIMQQLVCRAQTKINE